VRGRRGDDDGASFRDRSAVLPISLFFGLRGRKRTCGSRVRYGFAMIMKIVRIILAGARGTFGVQ